MAGALATRCANRDGQVSLPRCNVNGVAPCLEILCAVPDITRSRWHGSPDRTHTWQDGAQFCEQRCFQPIVKAQE